MFKRNENLFSRKNIMVFDIPNKQFIAISILKSIKKLLPYSLIKILIVFTTIFAQLDNFSNEEADFFRALKIFPLIANEQDGDYPRSTYLIPHDITVPKGKTLTLYPGSRLLFKKDTRLIIKGKIISKGNRSDPVLFCKLENKDYYIPVDSMVDTKWDGIFIIDSGKAELQYTRISDSKYALTVEKPIGEITLDSVQFYRNRYHNLKVENNTIVVDEYKNFFYQVSGQLNTPTLIPSPLFLEDSTSEPIHNQKKTKIRKFRVLMGTGLVIGTMSGAGGYFIHKRYFSLYNDSPKSENADKNHKLSFIGEAFRNSGAVLAGLCLTGFTISFLF